MRISSAQSSSRKGYTLTELLVALLVLALATALVAPILFRSSPQLELNRSADLFEQAARQARTEARLTGRDTLLSLDLDTRTLLLSPSGQSFRLNSHIIVRATVAEAELEGDIASVRFFPEGATTGGTFLLQMDEHQTALRIHWLTGQTERLDPDDVG